MSLISFVIIFGSQDRMLAVNSSICIVKNEYKSNITKIPFVGILILIIVQVSQIYHQVYPYLINNY